MQQNEQTNHFHSKIFSETVNFHFEKLAYLKDLTRPPQLIKSPSNNPHLRAGVSKISPYPLRSLYLAQYITGQNQRKQKIQLVFAHLW